MPTLASRGDPLIETISRNCRAAGFDLVQPCRVGSYNDAVEPALRLPDLGSPDHLALVIGNTREFWQPFLNALRRQPTLLEEEHPVHRYTEMAIGAILDSLPVAAEVRWAHDQGDRLVAMQRLAHSSGLAYLTESYLNVHPEFGPWIALRAVLILSLPAPHGPPPDLPHPCGSCSGKCLPAFERAIQAIGGDLTSRTVEARWEDWLAIRDACPTGREHRYSEPQIRYHYTKDRSILVEETAR